MWILFILLNVASAAITSECYLCLSTLSPSSEILSLSNNYIDCDNTHSFDKITANSCEFASLMNIVSSSQSARCITQSTLKYPFDYRICVEGCS